MKKIIFSLMFMVLLIGSVAALEFDNIKSYNEDTKTVRIDNAFGFGDTIAEIKLNTPLVYSVMRGKDRKVAEFTINNLDEYSNALAKMDFFDNSRSLGNNKLDRVFTYKYKTITGTKTIDDYGQSCVPNKIGNGTDCEYKVIGTHEEDIVEWVTLDTTQPLPIGEITIGIFTDVLPNDNIEWIPTFFGVEIEEWATWTDNFNNQILSYYKLDESSGAVLDSLSNGTNGVNTGAVTGVAGIIGTAYDFESGDTTDKIEYTSPKWCLFDSNSWTVNMWFKPESSTAGQQLYGCDGSALIIYFQSDNTVRLGKATVDNAPSSTFTVSDGVLTMITFRKNSTATYYTKDGTTFEQVAYTTTFAQGTTGTIGNGVVGAVDGVIDEIGIWNRTLTNQEVTDLYNGGAGLSYPNENYQVVLTSPANNSIFQTNTISLIGNITNNSLQVSNVSLLINGTINQTNTSGVPGSYNFTITLPDGSYNWSIISYANNSQRYNATNGTFNFSIDLVEPTVTLITPPNATETINSSISFSGRYNF